MSKSLDAFGQSYNSPSIFGQAGNANTSVFGTGCTTTLTGGQSLSFGNTIGVFQANPSGTSVASVFGVPASGPSLNLSGIPSVFGKSDNSATYPSSFGSRFGGPNTGGTTAVFGGSPGPFGISSGSSFASTSSSFSFGVDRTTTRASGTAGSGFTNQNKGSRLVAYSATKSTEDHNHKVMSLSAMQIYKDKSHEELRLEDYIAGGRGQKSTFSSFSASGLHTSQNSSTQTTSTSISSPTSSIFSLQSSCGPSSNPTRVGLVPPQTSTNPFTPQTPNNHFSPQTPFAPLTPNNPFGPRTSDNPFASQTSDNTFPPRTSDNLFALRTSDNHFAPRTSDNPFAPQTPNNPFSPRTPNNPFTPRTSDNPFAPRTSDNTFPPRTSDNPFALGTSDNPFTPRTSDNPFAPRTSDNPFAPQTPNNPFPPQPSNNPFSPQTPSTQTSTNLISSQTTSTFLSESCILPLPDQNTSSFFPSQNFTNPFAPKFSTTPLGTQTSFPPFHLQNSSNGISTKTSSITFPCFNEISTNQISAGLFFPQVPSTTLAPTTSSFTFPSLNHVASLTSPSQFALQPTTNAPSVSVPSTTCPPTTSSFTFPAPVSQFRFPSFVAPSLSVSTSNANADAQIPSLFNPWHPTPVQATNLQSSAEVIAPSTSSQEHASQSTVDQPVVNASPFGELPAVSRLSISQPGSTISVQYGISSMPVSDMPSNPIRLSSSLTSRHLSHYRMRLPVRKYDSKSEGPKVPFFSKDKERPSVRASTLIPRENPRALVVLSTELWPRRSETQEISSPEMNVFLLGNGEGVSTENNKSEPNNNLNIDLSDYKPDDPQEANISIQQMDGIKALMPQLTLSDYYTEPSITQMTEKEKADPGFCTRVIDFEIGRCGYGNIKFPGETDVRRLCLDSLVEFNNREVFVYKDDDQKSPVGEGLNKPAEVTLVNIYCVDKKTGEKYVEGPKVEKYKEMLIKKGEKQGAKFVSFDPAKGEWKFKVQHF